MTALSSHDTVAGVNPKRQTRSLKLIADFSDGFAAGWHFAVPDAYMECLDIRLTARVARVAQPDGSVRRVSMLVPTQGPNYTFTRGDTFYDARAAYSQPWAEALQSIQKSVRVLTDPDVNGTLTIQIMRPNPERTTLIPGEIHDVESTAFVDYLRSGVLRISTPDAQ